MEQLGYITGAAVRDQILLDYYDKWKFKHPTVHDLTRLAEKRSGLKLDWYKEYWVNSIKTIDYAIDSLWEEKGLTQVRSTHVEIMRSYAASEIEILRKVRVPNAVPYLFTALKIAAPASVITAFVSEYFGGSQNGLGSRITSNIANSKNAAAWAYVLGACLLGLLFYIISIVLENVASRGGVANNTNNNNKNK